MGVQGKDIALCAVAIILPPLAGELMAQHAQLQVSENAERICR